MQNDTTTLENSMVVSHKAKHNLTVGFSNCNPSYLPKWAENLCPHKTLHTSVYSSFIHNCQKLEEIKMSFNSAKKTKIMASGPITSWQIDGETVEIVADFILGASKITADGDCGHEIKRCLLLGRKAMTSLDSILKNRDITFRQRSV